MALVKNKRKQNKKRDTNCGWVSGILQLQFAAKRPNATKRPNAVTIAKTVRQNIFARRPK
eukprot:scaffold3600_cov171-Amphora_coffeaeformis.AAC.18